MFWSYPFYLHNKNSPYSWGSICYTLGLMTFFSLHCWYFCCYWVNWGVFLSFNKLKVFKKYLLALVVISVTKKSFSSVFRFVSTSSPWNSGVCTKKNWFDFNNHFLLLLSLPSPLICVPFLAIFQISPSTSLCFWFSPWYFG